jgi:hypothetical protein
MAEIQTGNSMEQEPPMAKHAKRHQISATTQAEAMRIARGTQRPGQTKEQTQLIARGIQKGIDQYRKQQNAKARDLDKRLKKASQQAPSPDVHEIRVEEKIIYKQHWLPWVLLILTWMAMTGYWITR